MRNLSRREWLALSSAGASAALVSCVVRRTPGNGAPVAPEEPRFSRPFRIPPVLAPTSADADTDYFDLVAEERVLELMPGLRTTVWAFNGSFPGPTIVARRGHRSVLRIRNALSVPTVVHLHGGNTAPESDGFPTDLIAPSGQRDYSYPNATRAATLWYHDHTMQCTGRNLYMGLAGMYLLRDDEEAALSLPSGACELPVILQERQFAPTGKLAYPDGNRIGAFGGVTLVNGVPWPRLEVSASQYRFRILNASNATRYELRLSSRTPLTLIGVDGGLLQAPVECPSLPLSMGERVDVIVDFSRFARGAIVDLMTGDTGEEAQSLVRCVVGEPGAAVVLLPDELSSFQPLTAASAVRSRVFSFGSSLARAFPPVSWTINGRTFDPDDALATARLGESELWTFQNHLTLGFAGMFHTVHLHLSPFQVLRRNGGPPLPHERGWKDTLALDRGERVDVLTRFENFRGRYLMHCHNLEHEDHEMMARFDVA